MPIYMNYGNIKGDVTTKGYEDWIELSSFQWGVGRGIASPSGSSADRESGVASVSEIVVTKKTDKASSDLFAESTVGKLNHTVKIDFTVTQAGSTQQFMEMELENCGVSGYSISGAGDIPSESISLNFTKITYHFAGIDPALAATPQHKMYDLATQTGDESAA